MTITKYEKILNDMIDKFNLYYIQIIKEIPLKNELINNVKYIEQIYLKNIENLNKSNKELFKKYTHIYHDIIYLTKILLNVSEHERIVLQNMDFEERTQVLKQKIKKMRGGWKPRRRRPNPNMHDYEEIGVMISSSMNTFEENINSLKFYDIDEINKNINELLNDLHKYDVVIFLNGIDDYIDKEIVKYYNDLGGILLCIYLFRMNVFNDYEEIKQILLFRNFLNMAYELWNSIQDIIKYKELINFFVSYFFSKKRILMSIIIQQTLNELKEHMLSKGSEYIINKYSITFMKEVLQYTLEDTNKFLTKYINSFFNQLKHHKHIERFTDNISLCYDTIAFNCYDLGIILLCIYLFKQNILIEHLFFDEFCKMIIFILITIYDGGTDYYEMYSKLMKYFVQLFSLSTEESPSEEIYEEVKPILQMITTSLLNLKLKSKTLEEEDKTLLEAYNNNRIGIEHFNINADIQIII